MLNLLGTVACLASLLVLKITYKKIIVYFKSGVLCQSHCIIPISAISPDIVDHINFFHTSYLRKGEVAPHVTFRWVQSSISSHA